MGCQVYDNPIFCSLAASAKTDTQRETIHKSSEGELRSILNPKRVCVCVEEGVGQEKRRRKRRDRKRGENIGYGKDRERDINILYQSFYYPPTS